MFRSKARWTELGERGTKYFCSLERARNNSKVCTRIMTETGEFIESGPEILKHQEQYYRELYDKDRDVSFDISNESGIFITEDEKQMCETPFQQSDFTNAIRSMKNGKTPGIDGLSVEFYKVCWPEISTIFINFVESSYQQEELPSEILKGVLNLIPKPKKDARLLKNLRPIMLLNVDYKIIEKMIAQRLDKTLQTLIHCDQTASWQIDV